MCHSAVAEVSGAQETLQPGSKRRRCWLSASHPNSPSLLQVTIFVGSRQPLGLTPASFHRLFLHRPTRIFAGGLTTAVYCPTSSGPLSGPLGKTRLPTAIKPLQRRPCGATLKTSKRSYLTSFEQGRVFPLGSDIRDSQFVGKRSRHIEQSGYLCRGSRVSPRAG